MNKETIEILAAEPRLVKFGDLTILVREADWLDVLTFLQKFSAKAADMVEQDQDGSIKLKLADKQPDGSMKLNLDRIPELILSSRELIDDLLRIATDVPAGTKLPPRVVLRIIAAALELNVTDDFFSAGRAVGEQLQLLVPARQKARSAS